MAETEAEVLPLAGVKVISFCHALAGNSCATYLAELGAEVVKVEARHRPDPTRDVRDGVSRQVTEQGSGAPISVNYVANNRSQRGITLDMRRPEGKDVFRRLAAVADVVMENFAVGVMQRWGFEYDTLQEINPRLIMLSMPGFGKTGPKRTYISYGSIISSYTGLTRLWGYSSGTHNDYVSAGYGLLAVLAALAQRARAGRGLAIDLAQSEAGAALLGPVYLDYTVNQREPQPHGNRVPGSAYSAVLKCAGVDRWLAVEVVEEAEWAPLCAAIGQPALAADPRFASPEARAQHLPELDGIVEAGLASFTPHQAMLRLQRAGIAAGAVQHSEDLARDPQLWSRQAVVELDDPDFGPLQFAQAPHLLSKTPGRVRRPAARLGQHTQEVLTRWIGMADDERQRLAEQGVI